MIITILGIILFSGCSDCPKGLSADSEGHCSWEADSSNPQNNEQTDTAPQNQDTNTDNETDPDPTLADACVQIDNQQNDPLSKTGQFFVQDALFAELIDIDGDADEIWAVGQGGIMIFNGVDGQINLIEDISPMGWDHRLHRVLVSETAVYATHRDRGLVVVDRDQKEIVQTFLGSNYSGLALGPDRLYLTAHDGNIHVYDTTNPLNIGHLNSTLATTNGFTPALANGHLFVADLEDGLSVIDISQAPTPIHTEPTIGGAQDLAISENQEAAYVAVGSEGIEIFDITNPSNPVSMGSLSLQHTVLSVDVDGDILWAASQKDLIAIDVSVPLQPSLINTEETDQWAMSVVGIGGKAYVADWGYVSRYERIPEATAPDLDPSGSAFLLSAGNKMNVTLANLGGDRLDLHAVVSDNPNHLLSISQPTIESNEQAILEIESTGNDPDGRICISSNDPDNPLIYIDVGDDGSALGLGPNSKIGLTAPDFNLIDTNGQLHRLSEARGNPVVLTYFATW